MKKSIHKFFGTAVKKIMNTLHASIFSFLILNLVKKAFWTFMLLEALLDKLKAKILTIIVLNLVRKNLSFSYIAILRGPCMT